MRLKFTSHRMLNRKYEQVMQMAAKAHAGHSLLAGFALAADDLPPFRTTSLFALFAILNCAEDVYPFGWKADAPSRPALFVRRCVFGAA